MSRQNLAITPPVSMADEARPRARAAWLRVFLRNALAFSPSGREGRAPRRRREPRRRAPRRRSPRRRPPRAQPQPQPRARRRAQRRRQADGRRVQVEPARLRVHPARRRRRRRLLPLLGDHGRELPRRRLESGVLQGRKDARSDSFLRRPHAGRMTRSEGASGALALRAALPTRLTCARRSLRPSSEIRRAKGQGSRRVGDGWLD